MTPCCVWCKHTDPTIPRWQEWMFQPLFLTSTGKIHLDLSCWEIRVWLESNCECSWNHSILLPFTSLYTPWWGWNHLHGCPALRPLEQVTLCFELTKISPSPNNEGDNRKVWELWFLMRLHFFFNLGWEWTRGVSYVLSDLPKQRQEFPQPAPACEEASGPPPVSFTPTTLPQAVQMFRYITALAGSSS